jgi:hypothetical protein
VSGRWLLLRRAGALWGLPAQAVRALRRDSAGGATIECCDSSSLQADELLELTAILRPQPVPECVAGTVGAGITGFSAWGGAPVTLLGWGTQATGSRANDGSTTGAPPAGRVPQPDGEA